MTDAPEQSEKDEKKYYKIEVDKFYWNNSLFFRLGSRKIKAHMGIKTNRKIKEIIVPVKAMVIFTTKEPNIPERQIGYDEEFDDDTTSIDIKAVEEISTPRNLGKEELEDLEEEELTAEIEANEKNQDWDDFPENDETDEEQEKEKLWGNG